MERTLVFIRGQVWYWEDPIYGRKRDGNELNSMEASLRYSRYVLLVEDEPEEGFISVIPCSSRAKYNEDIFISLKHAIGHSDITYARIRSMFPVDPKSLKRYICTVPHNTMLEIESQLIKIYSPTLCSQYNTDEAVEDLYNKCGLDLSPNERIMEVYKNPNFIIEGNIKTFIEKHIIHTNDSRDFVSLNDIKDMYKKFLNHSKLKVNETSIVEFIDIFSRHIGSNTNPAIYGYRYNIVGWKFLKLINTGEISSCDNGSYKAIVDENKLTTDIPVVSKPVIQTVDSSIKISNDVPHNNDIFHAKCSETLFAKILMWVLGRETVSSNQIMKTFKIGSRAYDILNDLSRLNIVSDKLYKQPRIVLPEKFDDIPGEVINFLKNNGYEKLEIDNTIVVNKQERINSINTEIISKKSGGRDREWTDEKITEFLKDYDSLGVNNTAEKYHISKLTTYTYKYRWSKLLESESSIVNNKTQDSEIKLPDTKDADKAISTLSNVIVEHFRQNDLYSKSKGKHTLKSQFPSTGEFYKEMDGAVYYSLIEFLGVTTIPNSDSLIIPHIDTNSSHLNTWHFLDKLSHDEEMYNNGRAKDIMKYYNSHYGKFGKGIDPHWLNSLMKKISHKLDTNFESVCEVQKIAGFFCGCK